VDAFSSQPITVLGLGCRSVTASIGIATFEPQLTGEDVLVNADLSMYDAKEAGRNRTAIYEMDERSQARTRGRFSWVQRIQAAFEEDRFSLLAQPMIDYSTGRVAQQELLLRMCDEHGDLIPPAAFSTSPSALTSSRRSTHG
jgi:predicted signal transduction protein with EAL and GGDEF domain